MQHVETVSKKAEHYPWIEFIKAFAMLAVVVDHSYTFLYTNRSVLVLMYFSVAVFIFISGLTSAISINRRENITYRYTLQRFATILIPYAVASLIYHLYQNQGILNFSQFLHQLVTFSAASPFYFIVFYLQLVAVAPFLFRLFKNSNAILRVVLLIIIYFISILLTQHTNIENIFGGGGKILGGTFLFVFSLGMVTFFYLEPLKRVWPTIFIFTTSALGLSLFLASGFQQYLISNPPNWYLILYAIFIAGFLFSFWKLVVEKIPYLNILVLPINLVGKYSLYIFLFHLLFLFSPYLIDLAGKYRIVGNIWLFRVWMVAWAVFLPILVGLLIETIIRKIKTFDAQEVMQNASQSTDRFTHRIKDYFNDHKEFRILILILTISLLIRWLLVLNGGQNFWPDEARYLWGYQAFSALLQGDHQTFLSTYTSMPAHSGFYLISGFLGILQENLAAFFHQDFSRMFWVPSLFFSALSAGSIFLVYLIALRASASQTEAIIAAALMALSSSMFYYSRHLFPYDGAMFLALLALWLGLKETKPQRYLVYGLILGASVWIYNGYWILCAAVAVVISLYRVDSIRRWLMRSILIGLGLLLPVYIILLFGLLQGSLLSINNLVVFFQSASQGVYGEGWSLPWEYLWHAEHGFVFVWLIGLILTVSWLARRKPASIPYVMYWIAAVATVYLIFIAGSNIFSKFVVYGRFARIFVPFFSLIAAFGFTQFLKALPKYRYAVLAAFLAVSVPNFFPPLLQKWPNDIEYSVARMYGEISCDTTIAGTTFTDICSYEPDDTDYVLLNVNFLYPIAGKKTVDYPGISLFKEKHPLSYYPYQYEGFTPSERAILRETDISIRLIETK